MLSQMTLNPKVVSVSRAISALLLSSLDFQFDTVLPNWSRSFTLHCSLRSILYAQDPHQLTGSLGHHID